MVRAQLFFACSSYRETLSPTSDYRFVRASVSDARCCGLKKTLHRRWSCTLVCLASNETFDSVELTGQLIMQSQSEISP